ncbi:hypothetical protein Btru_056909 [Bulinus truncatus]|nr:hypothetical protein Btru_056909 [Bulinus truncatus]
MVESVTCKASDLAEKSPASRSTVDTSQIHGRYVSVKEQAKDLLARSEQNVAHHQDFLDSCNSFASWLRTAVEKLTNCSDTYGEKSAIESKIDWAKSLLADLNEGSQRLTHAVRAGEVTLPSTSASGQTKIRQEIQAMNREFEEFRVQLMQSQTDLEICLNRWDEFEHSYQDFGNWLRETEVLLRRGTRSRRPPWREKKKHWEEYQYYFEDAISHQSSLDKVSEKAQALLLTNADAKTSHAITQLTTRYHGIISLAKKLKLVDDDKGSRDTVTNRLIEIEEIQSALDQGHSIFERPFGKLILWGRVEEQVNSHEKFRKSYMDCLDWLANTKHWLQRIADYSGDKRNLQERLHQLQELGQSQDMLKRTSDLGEKLCRTTSSKKAQNMVQKDVDSSTRRLVSFSAAFNEVELNLEASIANWLELDEDQQTLNNWLERMELKVKNSLEAESNLARKKAQLQEGEDLYDAILTHKSEINKIRDREMLSPSAAVTSEDAVAKLREFVNDHRLYDEALDNASSLAENDQPESARL